jgi:SAM-dependent methyltransferase
MRSATVGEAGSSAVTHAAMTPSQQYMREIQYRDGSNLRARIHLHHRFSTNGYGWWRWVFDHVCQPEAARVLELGCGTGGLWAANADRIPDSWRLTLSDRSVGMLREAAGELAGIDRSFSFTVADGEAIPSPDASFDCVIANHVLFFVPNIEAALAEIRRVLRPNGRLFASTNGKSHLRQLWALAGETRLRAGQGSTATQAGFGLENGRARLLPYFSQVRLHRYVDSLFITESEPIADFVASAQPNRDSRSVALRLAEFRAFSRDYVRRHGHVWVEKDSGMFEAGP